MAKPRKVGRITEKAALYMPPQIDSPEAAIRAIKKGLPLGAFNRLQKRLDVTEARLAGVIGIKLRTLARRKIDGRFTPEESDRIHRLTGLMDRTAEFFKSEEKAAHWLKAPQYNFNGIPPLDYADTAVGTKEVFQLLGRIENGVF
jgi:putative toxin-antitoxin system antitoxin component (TIGR02293 family)